LPTDALAQSSGLQRTYTPPWLTVALAGLLAGALDLTFALIFYGQQGATPQGILRGIASGLMGSDAAHVAAAWPVALGAALHFFTAVCAAFVFYLASRRLAWLVRRPVLSGAAFGVAVYVVMHFIVIPLSQIPFRVQAPRNMIAELCSHIFLFGIVIALGVARLAARKLTRLS
jgi:uncharacterized membrane protein YagU involved in acid resistance